LPNMSAVDLLRALGHMSSLRFLGGMIDQRS